MFLLKDVTVDLRRFSCFPESNLKPVVHVRNILEMVVCYLHFLEESFTHTKPLTDLTKYDKKFKNFMIFFVVFPSRTQFCMLQVIHVGVLVYGHMDITWVCNLAHLFELDI